MCFHTKFGRSNSKNKPATPLTSLKWSRAWQRHFLSYVNFPQNLKSVAWKMMMPCPWPFQTSQGRGRLIIEEHPPNLVRKTSFNDLQMILNNVFDTSIGFRFEKIWLSCTIHFYSLYLTTSTGYVRALIDGPTTPALRQDFTCCFSLQYAIVIFVRIHTCKYRPLEKTLVYSRNM